MAREAIDCQVETPDGVLQRYYPNGKLGGLTVDGTPPGALSQRVLLTVHVRQPTRDFEVRGVVAWARRKGSESLKACYGVDFEVGEDRARDRLLAFARHEVGPEALRFEHRVHVEVPIRVREGQAEHAWQLADLSTGGAFILTRVAPSVGTALTLSVRPPMSLLSLKLEGRVAWVRRGGPLPGMGVEFTQATPAQRERLQKWLARLAKN